MADDLAHDDMVSDDDLEAIVAKDVTSEEDMPADFSEAEVFGEDEDETDKDLLAEDKVAEEESEFDSPTGLAEETDDTWQIKAIEEGVERGYRGNDASDEEDFGAYGMSVKNIDEL